MKDGVTASLALSSIAMAISANAGDRQWARWVGLVLSATAVALAWFAIRGAA